LLPCLSGDATSIDRDIEPTEDADLDAKHTPRILPTTPADKDASTTPTPPGNAGPRHRKSEPLPRPRHRPTSTKRNVGRKCLLQLGVGQWRDPRRAARCASGTRSGTTATPVPTAGRNPWLLLRRQAAETTPRDAPNGQEHPRRQAPSSPAPCIGTAWAL
jgi:hypothetical protein